MTAPLFDHDLRAKRRDRAARIGVETFLFDRAFDECLERLNDVRRLIGSALLAGCPNPDWPERLRVHVDDVHVIDPGNLFAARVGGQCADPERLPFEPATFDLCLTVGLLDTANELAAATTALHYALKPGGLLLGAVPGGQSLPRLRSAMLAADQAVGRVSPHVHPRIEAASLAQLLRGVGLGDPVVDVDRVRLSYGSLDSLVTDLRAMGSTNILAGRSRAPVLREGLTAARAAFLDGATKADEVIEILHFAAWAPA